MSEPIVSFSESELEIDGEAIKLRYPILEAFGLGNKVIVLLDPDAHMEKFGQFPNLIAYDVNGKHVWTAQLPTTTSGDTYYRIKSRIPLIAYSFSGYACQIDEKNGTIAGQTFHK